MKSKFKVGDEVECIKSNANAYCQQYGGAGWKEGLRFKIKNITTSPSRLPPVYWRVSSEFGVFEPYLKLVGSNPNNNIIIKDE